MTSTPRTDAVAYDAGGHQHDDGAIVPADFARALERELADLNRAWLEAQSNAGIEQVALTDSGIRATLKDCAECQRELAERKRVGDELAQCAGQLGWTSADQPEWCRRAEVAVNAWRSLP